PVGPGLLTPPLPPEPLPARLVPHQAPGTRRAAGTQAAPGAGAEPHAAKRLPPLLRGPTGRSVEPGVEPAASAAAARARSRPACPGRPHPGPTGRDCRRDPDGPRRRNCRGPSSESIGLHLHVSSYSSLLIPGLPIVDRYRRLVVGYCTSRVR